LAFERQHFLLPETTIEGPADVKSLFRSWWESLQFLGEPALPNRIIFYSEGEYCAPFLRPVIDVLADIYDGTVYYLTSEESDSFLLSTPKHVQAYYVGRGAARTYVLNHMQADVVAMTTPDINAFHIKRSLKVKHYAYLHHSMVSTHMVYRKGAFDHFDSIFCVGPHHRTETREWEASQDLPVKRLFEHGYAPLDSLIDAARNAAPRPVRDKNQLNVLLAPSWGPHGVLETSAERVVQILLGANCYVRVRPHPRTRQLSGAVLDQLTAKFQNHPHFDFNEDTTKYEAFFNSDVMISDWSGVAMEFAFGLERPVLFIDVPRKTNNPDYQAISTVPLEVSYREAVGQIISPDRLEEIPEALASLLEQDPERFRAKVRELRARYFYNVGSSASMGAAKLLELAISK